MSSLESQILKKKQEKLEIEKESLLQEQNKPK